MDSQTFHEDFQALSKLVESSEESLAKRSGQKQPSKGNVVESNVERSRSKVQEMNEKASFEKQDGRKIPKCEILYQQDVETTDAFLGLSQKTPSTVSCEDLRVKIFLPELEDSSEIHLECKPNRILLLTTDYKLFHYLPHEVKEEQGTAEWNSKEKLLTLNLPIKHQQLF